MKVGKSKFYDLTATQEIEKEAWLPDGYSRIFRSYVFGSSGFSFRTMAPLRYTAKFGSLPFLGLCPHPSTLAQSKERKGSNFAIWQPCKKEEDEDGSFFARGPGAEEEIAASSADASPGPVKRASADINTAFGRRPETAPEPGMIGLYTILFQLQCPFRLHLHWLSDIVKIGSCDSFSIRLLWLLCPQSQTVPKHLTTRWHCLSFCCSSGHFKLKLN